MFYEEILKALYKNNIKFAVTGGVALVLYGVLRLTVDLDLIVGLERENLKNFLKIIRENGYRPKLPVNEEDILNPEIRNLWREKKNMIVFSFYNPQKPIELIDIFIHEEIPFEEIESQINWFDVEDFKIPVISKEHLKKLKLLSKRPQDMADIEILEHLDKLKDEEKD